MHKYNLVPRPILAFNVEKLGLRMWLCTLNIQLCLRDNLGIIIRTMKQHSCKNYAPAVDYSHYYLVT